jgi:uncharacterized protein YjbI with pentapeptide repeats
MLTGQGNHGELSLQIKGDKNVSLKSGDKVAITNLPSGWSIAPDNPLWKWTSGGLTWTGTEPFPVSETPQLIGLTVTPPSGAGVGGTQVNVQLEKSDRTALSTTAYIVFNLMAPQSSLTAYAETPALVILTSPSAVPYPNTVHCKLLALAEVPSTQLTLSFHGRDAHGNTVDLSRDIKSDAIGIDVEDHPSVIFTNKGDGTWTATLPGLTLLQTLDVKIKNLSLSSTGQSPLVLLEVRCKTGQNTASAWFMAFGPYTVGVELDTTNPDQGNYRVGVGNSSTFDVYCCHAWTLIQNHMVQVPLDWFILDAAGQKVFPPVPARFSLNGQDPIEQQSEALYQIGRNTLCWVDTSNTTIARCDIDMVTSTSVGPFSFRDLDLSGWDFSNWTNLVGSDFTNAVLVFTKLSGARLDNCKMDGVTMVSDLFSIVGASFKGASFKGASIGNGKRSPLSSFNQCDLSGCNFDGASFEFCGMTDCNLDSSTFRKATISVICGNSKLANVDFSGSMLGDNFYDCDVSNANLRTAGISVLILTSNLTDSEGPCIMPPGWSLKDGEFVYH